MDDATNVYVQENGKSTKDSASTDAQRTSGYQLPNYPITDI